MDISITHGSRAGYSATGTCSDIVIRQVWLVGIIRGLNDQVIGLDCDIVTNGGSHC